jgi:ADP-heptose:LPS heptosyltransferase
MSSVSPVFRSLSSAARKIVVVDLGFLGDTVQLVPACWEIKRNWPAAELHTLSAPVGAALLALAPCVDRAWAFPLGPQSPPWWRHWDILRALRHEHFDLALNFSGADRTIFVTALTGARWRAAHQGGRRHFWNRWLISHWVPRRSPDRLICEQRLQVLAELGCQVAAPRFDLSIPSDDAKWAAETIPAGAIQLSVSASGPFKEWPFEHWLALVGELARTTDCPLVATGGGAPREVEKLRALAESPAGRRVMIFPGNLTIARLAAVLARCRLHIGVDSGTTHLAFALGVPTLTVFRDYPGRVEWMPNGPRDRQLVGPPCACLRAPQPACAEAGRARCLGEIGPANVARLAAEMLR